MKGGFGGVAGRSPATQLQKAVSEIIDSEGFLCTLSGG